MYSYGRETRLLPRCKCGRACPVGKRKCLNCLSTTGYKVIKGKDSRKGSKARGVTLSRPDKPRTRIKPYRESSPPAPMGASRINLARVSRKPKEKPWL